VLDESPFFNITAEVEPRTLFEFLARQTHTSHLVVLYGLIKNAVFPDWELTLLLPVPERLRGDLEVAAEVTYSRISTLVQWFYERTFAELVKQRGAADDAYQLACAQGRQGKVDAAIDSRVATTRAACVVSARSCVTASMYFAYAANWPCPDATRWNAVRAAGRSPD